jgi:uncharacterized iron-regulated protein
MRWFATVVLLPAIVFGCLGGTSRAPAVEDKPPERPAFWIDLYSGEPVAYEEMLDDLGSVGVVYLGERHRVERHHQIVQKILEDLAGRGVPLALGLEQLESYQQPIVDRYNRGEIDFDKLAELTDWGQRWHGYAQYRPIVEAAYKAGAPIVALNARAETIRQVARGGGLDKLDAKTRRELPADIQTNDPLYEKLMGIVLMVHASAAPERLRPMLEAQIARDESMAATLCGFLASTQGKGRTVLVLCGSGHVNYALGTVDRVRRRMPGVKDRVLLMSESGDVVLTPAEEAMSREISVTHEQLRAINRPIADYLHAAHAKPNDQEK